MLATKHKIWKVSPLGASAHEQTPVDVQGKVVALDFDSKNVGNTLGFEILLKMLLVVSKLMKNTSNYFLKHRNCKYSIFINH